MPAKLLYHDPQGREMALDLIETKPVFIGRAVDCDIRTEDARVSRRNCRISLSAGHFLIEDLGSSNGTFVNERRIQAESLTHGDVIRCGSLQVRFVEMPTSAGLPAGSPVVATPVGAMAGHGPSTTPSVPQAPVVVAEAQAAQGEHFQEAAAELEKSRQALTEAAAELESLRKQLETSETEAKRLRGEAISSREEMARLRREAAKDKEELQALQQAADALRADLKTASDELLTSKSRLEEQREELAAKERQIERAQEDVHKTRKTLEELRNKLAEQQKTKDEGWRELNNRLSELEQLREVLREQERILEERRVGLIALETAVKDLRAEREKLLHETLELKSQRDELRAKVQRQAEQLEAQDEELRKLSRTASGKDWAGDTETRRRAAELKVELGRLEAERGKVQAELEAARAEQEKAQAELDALGAERKRAQAELGAAQADRERLEAERGQLASDHERLEAERGQLASERQRFEVERAALPAAPVEAAAAGDGASGAALRTRALEVYEGINGALSELRTTILTAKGLYGEIRATVADEDAREAIAEAIAASMEHAEDAKGLLRSLRELAQS